MAVPRGDLRFRGGQRRKMVWARDFNITLNTAGLVVDLLQGFINQLGITKPLPGMTITRIVGTHTIRVVSADDAFTRWEWGLVVADQSHAPTVTDNPLTQPTQDWMFVRQEAVVQVVDAGTPTVKRVAAHYDIDIKAQRKLQEIGQTLFYVGDNPDGDNFDINFQFNILLKLP